MSKARRWTDGQLRDAISRSRSFAETLRNLGLSSVSSRKLIKASVKKLGLDTSHFSTELRDKALANYNANIRLSLAEVFRLGGHVNSSRLSRKIRQYKLLAYQCVGCGNLGEHNGLPLSLQIDHVNGIRTDNRIENLRFLCPNCHSQTPTFSGRALKGRKRQKQNP